MFWVSYVVSTTICYMTFRRCDFDRRLLRLGGEVDEDADDGLVVFVWEKTSSFELGSKDWMAQRSAFSSLKVMCS
jgi:hypothetical protein